MKKGTYSHVPLGKQNTKSRDLHKFIPSEVLKKKNPKEDGERTRGRGSMGEMRKEEIEKKEELRHGSKLMVTEGEMEGDGNYRKLGGNLME